MNGVDARRRRSIPEPARQRSDRRGLAGSDDLDAAVSQVLDPSVELQAYGLLGRRGAVVNTLHATGDYAANRLPLAHDQLVPVLPSCVERSASTARFFARTAFMRAGP